MGMRYRLTSFLSRVEHGMWNENCISILSGIISLSFPLNNNNISQLLFNHNVTVNEKLLSKKLYTFSLTISLSPLQPLCCKVTSNIEKVVYIISYKPQPDMALLTGYRKIKGCFGWSYLNFPTLSENITPTHIVF